MDSDIVFMITTYNRPASCRRLVDQLSHYGDVYIIDDGSNDTYLFAPGMDYGVFVAKKNHGGKSGYYKTVNQLWESVPKKYKYYFNIQDDVLPVEGFAEKAIKTWNEINDVSKICLNTYVCESSIGKKNWTNFQPIEYDLYRHTQWVDLCSFMCEEKFFIVTGQIPRINFDWRNYPEKSSGVGSHISRKLHIAGYGMYQTKTSLFIPQSEAFDSKMNAWRTDNLINTPVL